MTKLPRISGRECVRALERVGFSVIRQKGSHIIMRRADPFAQVTVPDHRELHTGTLRDIIRDAGLTVDEFMDLL
jgi:predicted RNA binding protein YcfA (HicA-like mRNA interferase family)